MKKLFLLFTLSVLFLSCANAQDFKFGIKAGFSFNKAFSDEIICTNSEETGTSVRFGTQSGVYGAYVLNENLQIGADLLYGYQGYRIKGDYEHLAMGLNYVNLPIYAKYYITEAFSAEVGPQFGFCLGGKYTHYEASRKASVKLPSDRYNKFDLAITAALNYDFEYLTLWARYAYGFVKIFKDADTDGMTAAQINQYQYYYPANAKNSVLTIGLAYRIFR